MRLYRRMRKRQAKKLVGRNSIIWNKLLWGSKLKVGDLVHTCRGFNEVIDEIEPESICRGRNYVVFDFEIITDGGQICSLVNCCSPAFTAEQVIANFNWYRTDDGRRWLEKHHQLGYDFAETFPIKEVLAGECPFDERGCYVKKDS